MGSAAPSALFGRTELVVRFARQLAPRVVHQAGAGVGSGGVHGSMLVVNTRLVKSYLWSIECSDLRRAMVYKLDYLDTCPYTGRAMADTEPRNDTRPWYDEVAFPALLRAARTTYGAAIRAALAEIGCADVPRNGAFVLGSIARNGAPMGDVIRGLGVSKQAAGQVVDTLVVRGYLERTPDPDDRRRMSVSLTERGRVAAAASRSAVDRVDAALFARVGADQVATARAALGALIELAGDHNAEARDAT
jgi:DNA-binding MarR family transcriptional regulator